MKRRKLKLPPWSRHHEAGDLTDRLLRETDLSQLGASMIGPEKKDDMRLKLSSQGRRSLKAGLDGESLEMTLLMEVMKHVDEDISEENLCDVLDTLVARCGSIENAIVALKTGKHRIENIAIYDLPDSINAAYAEFNEQSFDDEAFNRCVRHLKRLLLVARDQVPDQESWEAWLAKNCPDISPPRAADIIKNWA